jgi:hypothetical protein
MLQIHHGDHNPAVHKVGFVTNLNQFVPQHGARSFRNPKAGLAGGMLCNPNPNPKAGLARGMLLGFERVAG